MISIERVYDDNWSWLQWQEVALGVSFLHHHDPLIIHGDLKPVRIQRTLKTSTLTWFFCLVKCPNRWWRQCQAVWFWPSTRRPWTRPQRANNNNWISWHRKVSGSRIGPSQWRQQSYNSKWCLRLRMHRSGGNDIYMLSWCKLRTRDSFFIARFRMKATRILGQVSLPRLSRTEIPLLFDPRFSRKRMRRYGPSLNFAGIKYLLEGFKQVGYMHAWKTMYAWKTTKQTTMM